MVEKITIGLLECDHVRPELRHINGDYRQMFPALFARVSHQLIFRFYDVINGEFPVDAGECNGYLCTGSSFSVYEDVGWIHRLASFVRLLKETRIPYAGICFGHQMLGYALGGEVKKSEKGWCAGVHEFTIATQLKWMAPPREKVRLLMMCQDQVVTLPAGASTIASAPDCQNAMISCGNTMLGIQAHPEFSRAYNRALMELRVGRIGSAKVEQGIASLQLSTHEIQVAGWIVNFFSNLPETK